MRRWGTWAGRAWTSQSLLGQAGVGTTDPSQMSHGDLVSTTLALARAHPEVMQMVASRFPAAQGLLGSVLGGGAAQGAEGGRRAGCWAACWGGSGFKGFQRLCRH